ADDLQAGNVREVGLGILRVERAAVYAAARGPAQDNRHRRAPTIVRFRQHVGDLVEGATDEVHELELGDRTHAGERRAEAGVHDGHLGDWRVHHALGAEAVDQAFRGFESAAVDADVFPNAE